MKKVSIVTTTILLFSTGCAVTIPVRGSIGGKDDFMGTAIATLSEGNMQVISQSGLTCTGVLTRPSLVQGTGTIKCSDGRSGNFVFVKTNDNGGTGIGNDMRGSTVHCDKDSDSASCTNF
jgi:hypothetical protein